MAVQVDGQALAAFLVLDRRQYDAVDQFAHVVQRVTAVTAQRLTEPGDFVPVVTPHLRMNEDGIVLTVLEPRFKLCLAVFKIAHLVLDPARRHAVHERLHEPVEFAPDLRERAAVARAMRVVLAMQAIHLARVFLTEEIAQRRVHQVMLQAFQHRGIEHVAPHGAAVVAGALEAGRRAADALRIEVDVTAAATAAAHQAR